MMVAFYRMSCVVLGASLLVLAACYRESASAEPTKQPSSTRLTNERAKALALKVHARAAAFDQLPKFFYRVKSGNGVVDNMRDREECSIEGLKEALDGPVADADWLELDETLAWTE